MKSFQLHNTAPINEVQWMGQFRLTGMKATFFHVYVIDGNLDFFFALIGYNQCSTFHLVTQRFCLTKVIEVPENCKGVVSRNLSASKWKQKLLLQVHWMQFLSCRTRDDKVKGKNRLKLEKIGQHWKIPKIFIILSSTQYYCILWLMS